MAHDKRISVNLMFIEIAKLVDLLEIFAEGDEVCDLVRHRTDGMLSGLGFKRYEGSWHIDSIMRNRTQAMEFRTAEAITIESLLYKQEKMRGRLDTTLTTMDHKFALALERAGFKKVSNEWKELDDGDG
jgi:hypothetical protein